MQFAGNYRAFWSPEERSRASKIGGNCRVGNVDGRERGSISVFSTGVLSTETVNF
jgi:hypothetical protein